MTTLDKKTSLINYLSVLCQFDCVCLRRPLRYADTLKKLLMQIEGEDFYDYDFYYNFL